MGVKFGTEEGTEGPLLRAKFHPYRCNDKGIGPLKLKFLLIFGQNVKYKRRLGYRTLKYKRRLGYRTLKTEIFTDIWPKCEI